MIRLPRFFKRKSQSDDLELGVVGRRTAKRAAPRSFQRAAEAQELELTEDPEQQRARHRLIGAAVLVLIAVVGLPRILDNQPKTAPNDIAVNIVTSLPMPGADSKPDTKPETKVETKAEAKADEKPKVEAPVDSAKSVSAPPDSKAETKIDAKVDKPSSPAPASKPNGLGLGAGEEVVAATNAKPKTEDANKAAAANSSANSSSKYVIQIGAFASESNVNALVARLKAQKIPSFVSNKTNSEGNKIFLVRAGPYTDKDAAESAEKKIKAMGLTPRLVETGKQ